MPELRRRSRGERACRWGSSYPSPPARKREQRLCSSAHLILQALARPWTLPLPVLAVLPAPRDGHRSSAELVDNAGNAGVAATSTTAGTREASSNRREEPQQFLTASVVAHVAGESFRPVRSVGSHRTMGGDDGADGGPAGRSRRRRLVFLGGGLGSAKKPTTRRTGNGRGGFLVVIDCAAVYDDREPRRGRCIHVSADIGTGLSRVAPVPGTWYLQGYY